MTSSLWRHQIKTDFLKKSIFENIDLRKQAKSTDCDKLTSNQRFRHRDFVTVISSQSEGLGKMVLRIVKYFYDCTFHPIGVIWFAVSLSRSVVVNSTKVTSENSKYWETFHYLSNFKISEIFVMKFDSNRSLYGIKSFLLKRFITKKGTDEKMPLLRRVKQN